MKILHAVESYFPAVGGMQEVVKRISEGLVAKGHDVTIATKFTPARSGSIINGVNIETFEISGNSATGISADIQEMERYISFVTNGDFDIVTFFAAQQWATDLCLPHLSKIGARKIFVPTGFSGLYHPWFKKYFETMTKWIREFDMSVFLSNDYRDINFARASGASKICIIPNGASQTEFEQASTFDVRKEYNLPSDMKLILLVGSHTGEKGHKEAIQIFQRLTTENICLIIAGNTPPWIVNTDRRKTLKQKIKSIIKQALSLVISKYKQTFQCPYDCIKLGKVLNESSEFKRRRKRLLVSEFNREQVVSIYKQADLFLFPSNIECSPIVLFESMAGKTAFLSTDVGNAREIVSWSGGGIILPTTIEEDGTSHAKVPESALITDKLLNDDKLRNELATAGYNAWLNRFTWEIIVDSYQNLYKDVLAVKTP